MTIDVKVPEVGESVTEVYIGEWRKSEGEDVRQDEDLVELESDKATFDAPAPVSGVLVEILKHAGDRAEVGEVIARIDSSGSGGTSSESKKPKESGAKAKKSKDEKAAEKQAASKEPAKPEKRHTEAEKREDDTQDKQKGHEEDEAEPRVMPAARRVLEDYNLNAEDVEATGPGGRLLKEDVVRYVQRQSKESTEEEVEKPTISKTQRGERKGTREERTVPLSPIRRRIASRLVSAQQNAALLTTFNEVDMSAVMEMRNKYRDAFQKKYNIKLGFMSFFVKAAIEALQMIPQVNAELRDDEIVFRNYCDIGIAIGAEKGLVVPILKNAEVMGFAEIELAIDDLARRAQKNELKVDELRGGTFTISNGGIYGSLLSTPIVNPPQSGVLGMHAIQERPVVVDGQIVARPMMYLALTYDHRLVDGRDAVTFLRRIKDCIEEPARLLIEV